MDTTEAAALDRRVRAAVYHRVMATGRVPVRRELAELLGQAEPRIAAALQRLADAHELVLQPGGEILMAMPWSAVPTPFEVRCEGTQAYGNCAWDALGVVAMTRRPSVIRSACACCGDGIELTMLPGQPPVTDAPVVMHFALPVREWWRDVAFT